MYVVVRRVACDDQPDVRYVQDRSAVGVGVPDVDGNQLMAFKLERRPVQRIRDGIAVGDLAREPGLPECLDYLGRGRLAHADNQGVLSIVFFLFAIARAWQLVGARDTSLLSTVAGMAQRQVSQGTHHAEDDQDPPGGQDEAD